MKLLTPQNEISQKGNMEMLTLLVFVSIWACSSAWKCGGQSECLCTQDENIVTAKCIRMGLVKVPQFSLTRRPHMILDVSENKITYIPAASVEGYFKVIANDNHLLCDIPRPPIVQSNDCENVKHAERGMDSKNEITASTLERALEQEDVTDDNVYIVLGLISALTSIAVAGLYYVCIRVNFCLICESCEWDKYQFTVQSNGTFV